LGDNLDSRRLTTVPGMGPANALAILAEACDIFRFRHRRQFLNFCGLNLSTLQSRKARGQSRISKYGNPRLRTALWMAAQTAVRMRRIVSAASSTAMFAPIHSMPTSVVGLTLQSLPNWRG
jgi:transposase